MESDGVDELMALYNKHLPRFNELKKIRDEYINWLAQTARNEGTPHRLYHYTTYAGASGIVRSKQLWATDFRNLNDTTEITHGTRLLISELDIFRQKTKGDISTIFGRIIDYYNDWCTGNKERLTTYIVSLSEAPDMLSQWRAYADAGKGCCIEFNMTDSHLCAFLDNGKPWESNLLPVIYKEAKQRVLIQQGIERVFAYLSPILTHSTEEELGLFSGFLLNNFDIFCAGFKHQGFSEEKEWRAIVSPPDEHVTKNKRVRVTNKNSYLETMFCQWNKQGIRQRKLLPIASITHGPLANSDDKEEIQKLLSSHGYADQIVYHESQIPLRQQSA